MDFFEEETQASKKLIAIMLRRVSQEKFSAFAQVALEKCVLKFLNILITLSIAQAKRQKGDLVSSTNVEFANRGLLAIGPGHFSKLLGTLGGILLGPVLPNILEIIGSGDVSAVKHMISTLLGIIGAFMIAISWRK